MHMYNFEPSGFAIFIIITHVIIFTQVSSDDCYEMKFQMLKEVRIVLKYRLFNLVHTYNI